MCCAGAPVVTSDVIGNGSYLRIKTATLAYDLPLPRATKVFKSSVIYVTVQNLYTFTKYSGYDPEVNSFRSENSGSLGTDYNAYPNYRTYLLGIELWILIQKINLSICTKILSSC